MLSFKKTMKSYIRHQLFNDIFSFGFVNILSWLFYLIFYPKNGLLFYNIGWLIWLSIVIAIYVSNIRDYFKNNYKNKREYLRIDEKKSNKESHIFIHFIKEERRISTGGLFGNIEF